MGSFEDAHPIGIRATSVGRAVKARLSEREGNFVDLWIHVPVNLVPYAPPSEGSVQVTHTFGASTYSRACLSWGTSFPSWAADYVGTVNDFWDGKLQLRHTSMLAAAAGTSHEYPTVRCRFHCNQVERGFAVKRILVTAVAPNDQPTSSCAILGSSIYQYRGGIAAGYHSLLDSNDLNQRPRVASNGEQTNQIAVAHEMGHYIGLQHRCRGDVGPVGRTPADATRGGGQVADERFGDRRGGDEDGDPYCTTAEDGSLTHDAMACGMVINPWHAYVWQQIWESLATTPDGVTVPSAGWVPEVVPQP